jgi:hypothetical protein
MTDLTKNGFKAATCDEQQIEALAYPRAVEPYFRLYRSACGRPATKRKRESQQLCRRRKCKSHFAALKAGFLLGRYHRSSHALDASRNPTKPGTFSRLKSDRAWRQAAGPPVDMRLATIGADDAVKPAHRVNHLHYVEAGKSALIQKHHAPVNIVGGYRFPNAPQIELTTGTGLHSDWSPPLAPTNGDQLDIPDFLPRTQPGNKLPFRPSLDPTNCSAGDQAPEKTGA